jgi:uncharacterized protein (TIGR04551 family)
MHYTNGRPLFQPGCARRRSRRLARLVLWACVLLIGVPVVAYAQIGPGGPGMGGGGAPGGGSGSDAKKEGVAEAAPKTPSLLPTTPALPAPKSRRKKWKLLELDGYYRMRTDWFKNFNEGFPDNGVGGGPFPNALGCKVQASVGAPCNGSLASANMRLRLEPTINLDEGTSVHIQADLLDNLLLGSTPDGVNLSGVYPSAGINATTPPITAFGNGTQASAIQGVNTNVPAVQIKRAWGEVALPIGQLKFGRMPNQWGMGILYNAGGYDPINGTYNYDADYGDTVDRASFSLLIPGTNLRAMVGVDWDATSLVSSQTAANKGNEGHPFDLDDSSDINGYVGAITRIDSPQDFKDTMARGELALNYGLYFEYKSQSWDYTLSDFTLGGATETGIVPGDTTTTTTTPTHYVPRNFKQYSPDLWLKAGYNHFMLEAEFAAQLGEIDALTDTLSTQTTSADIRKYGGAARLSWTALEDKFKASAEGGFATGDSVLDPNKPGILNLAYANIASELSDGKYTRFSFNKDYQVDMILWRRLVGAVSNAAYIKPSIQYDITHGISVRGSNITSFALRPVATPGHSSFYGTEFDTELFWQSGGLYIGISYGVLFPFGALNHPADGTVNGVTQKYGFTDPATGATQLNVMDASTSHAVQSRIVLAF